MQPYVYNPINSCTIDTLVKTCKNQLESNSSVKRFEFIFFRAVLKNKEIESELTNKLSDVTWKCSVIKSSNKTHHQTTIILQHVGEENSTQCKKIYLQPHDVCEGFTEYRNIRMQKEDKYLYSDFEAFIHIHGDHAKSDCIVKIQECKAPPCIIL